ncbi:MAG: hypothetical protein GY756_08055 [bacterium]|nr:hypothetical protein [bacterium]
MIPIDHDLHIHTYLSSCCRDIDNQRPKKILSLAEQMGLKTIGFSDHIWTNKQIKPNNWYSLQNERQIIQLRRGLKSISTPLHILIGCEADTITPNKFTITQKYADTLDYVNLSCSHFHMKELVQQPTDNTPYTIGKHLLRFFDSAVKSGIANNIVHPLLPFGYENQYDFIIESLSDNELLNSFALAAELNIGIEITVSFIPKLDKEKKIPLWSIDTPIRVLSLAKKAGCKFYFASDAHSPNEMQRIKELEYFVKCLSLSDEDIISLVKE